MYLEQRFAIKRVEDENTLKYPKCGMQSTQNVIFL